MNHQALFSSKDTSTVQLVLSAAIFVWRLKGEGMNCACSLLTTIMTKGKMLVL